MLRSIRDATGGQGADLVLDTVGGDTFSDSLRSIAYAGRVVALANVALAPSTVDTRDFYPKNGSILGFQITALMEHGYDPGPDLRALLDEVAAHRYQVPIDSAFPLAQAAQAHERLEGRHALSKVILTPR